MKKTLLITIALFISIIGYSQTFIKNNITYTVTSTSPNKVGVSDYNIAAGTDVTIPASVTQDAAGKSANFSATTYSVTTIEGNAFSNKPITSVTIPSSVTEIKFGAFFNTKISSVIIPSNVTDIGSNAFSGNGFLSCVTSENTTPPTISTNTNGHSFGDNRNTITLKIPSGTFSAYANPNNGAQWTGFSNGGYPYEVNDFFTSNFIKYKITSMTNNTVIVSGYNMAGGSIVNIPSSVSDCTLTYTVVGIADYALGNKAITSVTIPNTFTYIGKSSFNNCELTSLTIPGNVTTIGQSAFSHMASLTSIVLSDGITTIGDYAFSSNGITSISIPASVTSIGTGAFAANQFLANVYSYATTPATVVHDTSNNDSFGSNKSAINLHIPTGTTDIYITNPNTGADWTGFNSVTEDGALSTSNFEIQNNVKLISFDNKIEVKTADNINFQKYTIYSISGSKAKTGTENRFSTNTLPTGIYILKLNFDKGTFTKKIVVQ